MSRCHLLLLAPVLAAGCATQPAKVEPGRHIALPPARLADLPKLVERPVFLPKPSAQAKTDTYSVVVNNVPVRDLMFALARDAKLNVDVHPLIRGTVTVNALNQTLPQILDRISNQVDMRYTLDKGVLTIVPDRPYIKNYALDYVNIARTTKSNVTISTSVAAAGGSVQSGGGGGGGGSGNGSITEVSNLAENKFWERLEGNIRTLLASSRRVSAEEKTEREAMEAKDDAQRHADMAEQKAENTKRQEDRLKVAQTVAQAGAGAPALFSMLDSGGKAAAPAAAGSNDDIFVHPETGVLSINATSREHAKIQDYLDRVSASARRQVLIEATIVEVALNDHYQTGIDWRLFKNDENGTAQDNRLNINQSTMGDNLAQLPFTLLSYTKRASSLFNGADFTATIKALEQFGKTKVLSSPKIMALNNQTALLKVVDEKVYFTITVDVESATTTTPEKRTYTSELHTIPIGMVMSVTPQISDNDNVSLNIRPTISRITGYKADPAVALVQANSTTEKIQSLVPEIQVREVESTLRLASGQAAILGGLIQDQVQNQRDGLPTLSRLPWGVGDLFSYRDDRAQKTELVVFLRPVVIREASLNGDLADFRQFVPTDNFFSSPKDELSVFKSGLPAR
ncbi:pilus (MSHA type) biogenesis protein MshL [Chitinimonas arctica]|uniref:Pilus (MSHA type) biogenesis protein MshL n=1 Tax=Chitinimonas arctica TaxID=2594795 RepID=A0A516SEC0_9NEIS|nr:pilus (MSHA type) biogenesis protein MshL [Chitinimonas arctica]QDQ26509.1 pilus (MSHA type) biogenesis protein MshL [Chitinimonas arctica]